MRCPTYSPTNVPTYYPTTYGTDSPTNVPTYYPTTYGTDSPTYSPTYVPTYLLCEDDPLFSDGMGRDCSFYEKKDCLVADDDQSLLGMVAVQEHCPKTCGFCHLNCDERNVDLKYYGYRDVCKRLITTQLSWEKGPTRAYRFTCGMGPFFPVVGSLDVVGEDGKITRAKCDEHLAMSGRAASLEWNFDRSPTIQYNFSADLTLLCASWEFEDNAIPRVSDAPDGRASLQATTSIGGMYFVDNAIRLTSEHFASLKAVVATTIGGMYRVEYKSLVEESRDFWVCKPGMVSHGITDGEDDCRNAMKYVQPRQNGEWQVSRFDFVATSASTRLTLWGPGASFEYVRMTKMEVTVASPRIRTGLWMVGNGCSFQHCDPEDILTSEAGREVQKGCWVRNGCCDDKDTNELCFWDGEDILTSEAGREVETGSRMIFPEDSAMRCVEESCAPQYLECLKDVRCSQNFAAGQRNGFGVTLHDLWNCVNTIGSLIEQLSNSSHSTHSTQRLSEMPVHQGCMQKSCIMEFWRCELTYECAGDNVENPHPLRVELEECLVRNCVTTTSSPTPVPSAFPTRSPTWDPSIPVRQKPGLHVLFSDDFGDSETLSLGEDYSVPVNYYGFDASQYTFPTVIYSNSIIDLTAMDICNLDKSVLSALKGTAVLFKIVSDSLQDPCSPVHVLYQHGVVLYIQELDECVRECHSPYPGDPECSAHSPLDQPDWNPDEMVRFPVLYLEWETSNRLKTKGVKSIQYSIPHNKCNTRHATDVTLPGMFLVLSSCAYVSVELRLKIYF
jgi:hypothetical protein